MLIFSGIILYIFSCNFFGFLITWEVVTVPLAYSILLFINRQVERFRVWQGSYLTNEADTRRLINFVLENSKDIDFKGPDGNRKIMSDEEILGIIEQEVVKVSQQKGLQGI